MCIIILWPSTPYAKMQKINAYPHQNEGAMVEILIFASLDILVLEVQHVNGKPWWRRDFYIRLAWPVITLLAYYQRLKFATSSLWI